jgi:abequosyltransferase
MPVLLSICIPTHNFGRYISETLQSVISQASRKVEIVILDGASTDDTKAVVEAHRSAKVPIKYCYQPHKGGIDADMARVVELARGEYCWLLSADDTLVEGAISRMLREIENAHDIYLCNRIWCDKDLNPLVAESWLRGEKKDRTYTFSDRNMLKRYLDAAQSVGALFSCMSSIVVKRAVWLSVADGLRLKGTNYAHVYRLFSAGRKPGAQVRYIAEPLVMCRGDNDSFLNNGIVARYLLDMHGYDELATLLFSADLEMQRRFKSVVVRQHRWFVWIWLSSLVKTEKQRLDVHTALARYGYPQWRITLTDWLAKSRIGFALARYTDSVLLRLRA